MTPIATLTARTEDDTCAIGRALAPYLCAGDAVLLSGDLGVGKTVLARGVIRALAGEEIDVPSPSYALIQEYPTDPPLRHADLYRVDDPSELLELGLMDATEVGILLVEWPEHGDGYLPDGALHIVGRLLPIHREWTISGSDAWARRLAPMTRA